MQYYNYEADITPRAMEHTACRSFYMLKMA
jgi:hypothetical protein